MKRSMYETLEEIAKIKDKKKRIEAIREEAKRSPAILTILEYAYGDKEWLLPKGKMKYRPCKYYNPTGLLKEVKRLYLFVKGGNDNLSQSKRENMFLAILEYVDPNDAELLIKMKDGKQLFKTMSKRFVKEAFPEVFEK